MRVGVVADRVSPEVGGVFTFIRPIIDAIRECSSNHEFVIWEAALEETIKWRWMELVKHAGESVGAGRLIRFAAGRMTSIQAVFAAGGISPVEQFILESDIDVMWFLSQTNAPVSVPYFTTVWDLQHRRQPFFPEVSTTGWTWDARERAFRSNLLRASRIITGTQAGKDEIIAFYGVCPQNVIVVPMPIAEADLSGDSDSRIDVSAKYGLKSQYLFYPARFWPHKNHVNLLLALDLLKRNAGVVLTGSDKGNLNHVCVRWSPIARQPEPSAKV